jgi:hypothetical protein
MFASLCCPNTDGVVPTLWPHSRNWGYAPSGGVGLVVIIIIIVLLLLGRI